MFLSDQPNHYEVLEVSPQASGSEIRNAYLKMKAAYSQDSAATYSLLSREETEELVKRIEEAHQILSSSEKRKEYDESVGLLNKVFSIDRVPPMDSFASTEDLLVPPTTHFETAHPALPSVFDFDAIPKKPIETTPNLAPPPDKAAPTVIEVANFQLEMDQEMEWKGSFIRRIREVYCITLEELADYTRVSKNYLVAIEEEQYKKLPAPVFLRGFLIQISKKLKLPQEKLITAYLNRYKQACPEKF